MNEAISNILRDKNSGWRFNYYNDTEKTMWDIEVVRVQQPHEKKIAGLRQELDKAIKVETEMEDIYKNLSTTPTKGKEKALENLNEASLKVRSLRYTLTKAEDAYATDDQVHQMKMHQYLERFRARHLKSLRAEFMQNGDMESLRKGVEWLYEYMGNNSRESEDL